MEGRAWPDVQPVEDNGKRSECVFIIHMHAHSTNSSWSVFSVCLLASLAIREAVRKKVTPLITYQSHMSHSSDSQTLSSDSKV